MSENISVYIPIEYYQRLEESKKRLDKILVELSKKMSDEMQKYQHWMSVFQEGGAGATVHNIKFREGMKWLEILDQILGIDFFSNYSKELMGAIKYYKTEPEMRRRMGLLVPPEFIESPYKEEKESE